jgi:LacI family transcriptional regulator
MMEKVRRACEELGYMPNGAARALSTRRSRTIGAIVPSIENEGFARTISALQRRLKEHVKTTIPVEIARVPRTELLRGAIKLPPWHAIQLIQPGYRAK